MEGDRNENLGEKDENENFLFGQKDNFMGKIKRKMMEYEKLPS